MGDSADNSDDQARKVGLEPADGEDIQQSLGRMGMLAITGIDDPHMRRYMRGDEMRRAAMRMADHKHITMHGFEITQGIEQGFALASRRGLDADIEDIGREPFRRQFKGGAGA